VGTDLYHNAMLVRRLQYQLDMARTALRRLADPTEIAGFGDADDACNNTPEMQARLSYAKRAYEQLEDSD